MIYRFSSSVKADGPGAAATAVCIPAFRACMLNAAQPRSMPQRISSPIVGIGRGFYGKVYVLFAKQGGKWGKIACYMMLFSCGYAIINQTPKVIPHGSAVSRLPSMPPLICIPAAISFHSRRGRIIESFIHSCASRSWMGDF